jgi:hypothetical protein
VERFPFATPGSANLADSARVSSSTHVSNMQRRNVLPFRSRRKNENASNQEVQIIAISFFAKPFCHFKKTVEFFSLVFFVGQEKLRQAQVQPQGTR